MSVILEFTIDHEAFAPGRVIGSATDGEIELERIVPVGGIDIPFFWVRDVEGSDLAASVEESDYIENLQVLDRVGDRTLYRVEWTGEYEDLVEGLTASEATILEASGSGTWSFRVRFPDHQLLADFYGFCTDHDIPIDVGRVYALTEESLQGQVFGLTAEQRDALVLALRRGYFATPRETNMDDLAAELGISQQAFSERLRRGTEKVLHGVLLG